MPTPLRNIRVDDELWDRAIAATEVDETDVSTVVRDALRRYAARIERRSGWCPEHGYEPCSCE